MLSPRTDRDVTDIGPHTLKQTSASKALAYQSPSVLDSIFQILAQQAQP